MSENYGVRRILDMRKTKKGGNEYLVDWLPSYASEESVSKGCIEEYKLCKNGVTIVGPYEPSMKNKPADKWDYVVKFGKDTFQVLKCDEVASKYHKEFIKYLLSMATPGVPYKNNNKDESEEDDM